MRNLKRSVAFLVIDRQSAVLTALGQDGPATPVAVDRSDPTVLPSKSEVSIVEPHVEVAGVRLWEHAQSLILCAPAFSEPGCNDGNGTRCQ
jgi:hypothetical protein